MYKEKKILATVCARGGSKGVKNKNIIVLGDKPVICYSLDCITKSKYIDGYIVSTDSDTIIDVVKNYGFEVKFKRPAELAEDKVSRIDVIRHAVEWVAQSMDKGYDVIVDLGVATPLKNAYDLDSIIELLIDNDYSNVFSVTKAARNPYYNMVEVINDKVSLVKTQSQKITDRRDAPAVYDMNDGLNIWHKKTLFSESPQFNDNTYVYVMPPERSVDIDEEIDLKFAEVLIKHEDKYIK